MSAQVNVNLLAACSPMVTMRGLSKAINLTSTSVTPDAFVFVSFYGNEVPLTLNPEP